MVTKFILAECFPHDDCLRDGEFETLGILDSIINKEMLSYIESEKYLMNLKANKNITCILTNKEIGKKLFSEGIWGIVICEDPRNAFFKFHNKFCDNDFYGRKRFSTQIGKGCAISKMASISKTNTIIGNNVIIEDFVSIKDNVCIGDNCIIRSGTVIGGIGFEFKKDDNTLYRVEHKGGVTIGNNVEIQYNCTIDKAIYPWDNTVIDEYSKLDNLIYIGHACKIGKRVMIPAHSVIGGRVVIESDAWIGIGCAIRNGVHIGKSSRCNMGAVVTTDVLDNGSVSGNFAIDHSKFIKHMKEIR